MVVYSYQFILAALSHYEVQVDAARIARDYECVGSLRFRAVWFREWLMYFPRENKAAEITQSTGESVTDRHVDAILSGVLCDRIAGNGNCNDDCD
jgi:hypothetical protein